jgi:hypothetical protein
MPDIGEYRVHAATCIQLAQQTDDPQSKVALLDIARAWINLFTRAEKSSHIALVHETPEPRWQVNQQQQQPQPRD